LLGQGNGCQGVPPSQINDGNLVFATGSSGSTVEGFFLAYNQVIVNSGVGGISIRRCRFYQDNSIIVNGSAVISECILDGSSSCVDLNTAGASVTVANSVLCNATYGIAGQDVTPWPQVNVSNCVFVGLTTPLTDIGTWSVSNSIFWDCGTWNGSTGGYIIASYNAMQFSMNSFPNIPGIDSTILTDPFTGYDESANYVHCTSNFYLPVGSGLINRGDPNAALDRDGTRRDIGLYGGPNPYVDSGAPDFPFVTQFFVPVTVPQNGVLEIRSTGRVGQGVGQ
jgi:hypothetical protein